MLLLKKRGDRGSNNHLPWRHGVWYWRLSWPDSMITFSRKQVNFKSTILISKNADHFEQQQRESRSKVREY